MAELNTKIKLKRTTKGFNEPVGNYLLKFGEPLYIEDHEDDKQSKYIVIGPSNENTSVSSLKVLKLINRTANGREIAKNPVFNRAVDVNEDYEALAQTTGVILIDEDGNDLLPYTRTELILDDNGDTLGELLANKVAVDVSSTISRLAIGIDENEEVYIVEDITDITDIEPAVIAALNKKVSVDKSSHYKNISVEIDSNNNVNIKYSGEQSDEED